jgi:hypothetical protein
VLTRTMGKPYFYLTSTRKTHTQSKLQCFNNPH